MIIYSSDCGKPDKIIVNQIPPNDHYYHTEIKKLQEYLVSFGKRIF